ncbi:MAG: dihydrodipicolinate synthase family protein [Anaerolineae bacterium]|nr:dihydrodipicolinate synthase family protein [Anaerolineae bacterium]
MTKKLYGIIPPLTTPFTEDGAVYEEGLRRLVEFQIEKGSHGLFICGTYGSGPIMTLEERKQVHKIVINQVKGRITVVAHVGTTSTMQSVELAQHAESMGADYIASISPYYHHHDERCVVEYFRALVKAVNIPVYVYNNPGASGVTLTPNFLHHLADVGVQGIKDSAFSYIEFAHFVLAMEDRPDFRFIVGTEGIALPALMLGAQGCVSGLANGFPELMVKLWDTYQAGEYEKASDLQLQVIKARKYLHIPSSTNAACYTVLHARGIDAGMPKAPILPVAADKANAMLAAFKEMGLL